MDALEALLLGSPERAWEIRRKFWCDPQFRLVAGDYRDAVEALVKLEKQQPLNQVRIEEYRQLAAEMLVEAIEMLKEARSR